MSDHENEPKNDETPTPEGKAASSASDGSASSASDETNVGGDSKFARYFSFAMLLTVIVLVGIVFYEVMARFFIPLFLAMILVVIFRPVHRWVLEKCKQRHQLAALLTTGAVLLIVLVPLLITLSLALVEGQQVLRQFNVAQLSQGVKKIRSKLNLEVPPEITVIDRELDELDRYNTLTLETGDAHRIALFEAEQSAKSLAATKKLPWLSEETNESPDPNSGLEPWIAFTEKLVALRQQHDDMDWSSVGSPEDNQKRLTELHDYLEKIQQTRQDYEQFKVALVGGKTNSWFVKLANPSQSQADQYVSTIVGFLRDQLFSLGGKGAAFAANFGIGLAIMIIAFYFFLLDGPGMLETFKGLSPIDDEHEQELASEFVRVSRAVVLATLLSALAQGLLAGIGFYFVGLESIFLLTVLSGVLAMVPFVGAAAVWVPCALYLYFVDSNLVGAIGLAIYGTAVISMADNVIKPLVLHGQSNLHPLFAFLSVIGGVGALGPIGILIGPMVVAFLQTLLKILREEMMDLSATLD